MDLTLTYTYSPFNNWTMHVKNGHSSNLRAGPHESSYGSNDITQSNLQQRQFFAQQQYPPTGSTLSELASVSGVGGYVIVLVELIVTQSNPRERLPAEGPPEGIHVHETLTCDGVL